MDLEWLEDFLALREVGSFTLAAHRNTNPSTPCPNRQRQSFTPDMIGRKRQIAFLRPTPPECAALP